MMGKLIELRKKQDAAERIERMTRQKQLFETGCAGGSVMIRLGDVEIWVSPEDAFLMASDIVTACEDATT